MLRRNFFAYSIKYRLTLFAFFVCGSVFLFFVPARSFDNSVVISKICPSGCATKDHQWLEVTNIGVDKVDFSGWRFLEDGIAHKLVASLISKTQTTVIMPGEHAIVAQKDQLFFQDYPDTALLVFDSSWGTLNKTGEEIGLRDSAENLVDSFVYPATTGSVLERTDLYVSGNESTNWKESLNQDNLSQTDKDSEAYSDINTEIIKSQEVVDQSLGPVAGVVISEFLPNPQGSDNLEFIEIFNPTKEEIDLSGCRLTDGSESKGFVFSKDTRIQPSGFYVLWKYNTKLSLNNDNDQISLFDSNNNLLVRVWYDDAKEGLSLSRDEFGEWKWSETMTPGSKNIIKQTIIKTKSNKPTVITATVGELKSFAKGKQVKVMGVITVEPGALGLQYFYISDKGAGAQVYLHNQEWPKLKVGDLVEVIGELSSVSGQTRIKLKDKTDIAILDHAKEPEPKLFEISNISQDNLSGLIKISGEVTELRSSSVCVDDNSGEIVAKLKSGEKFDYPTPSVGSKVLVNGILVSTKDGFQLLLRSKDDLTIISSPSLTKDIVTPDTEKGRYLRRNYSGVVAIGMTFLLMFFFIKTNNQSWLNVVEKIKNFVKKLKIWP